MYHRELEPELINLSEAYPVVAITGPRQSGKTTLAQKVFPEKPYINLEELDIREMATLDPRGFLSQYPEGAILDEIQQAPQLLSYIQAIVDKEDKKGLFILTGSLQLQLHEAISQSLAGRCALLNLLPMSLSELCDSALDKGLNNTLIFGGFPRIYRDRLDPTKAYRNYFQTYIERDLRQLINVKDLVQFQRFIRLCAGRIGQLLNAESLANDVGISSHTVKHWISILEASFILFRLYPYFENFGKRIIKSPKLYFTDVGLASYLLEITNESQINRDPLRGNLFENLVLLELMKARLNSGLDPQLYFYRDTQGHEIDIIFKTGNELVPIEVKSSKTFSKDFLKNLKFFQKITEKRALKGFLIYSGEQESIVNDIHLLNYRHAKQTISLATH